VDEVLDGAHPSLGSNGRRAVERGYSWAGTLARLDGFLDDTKRQHGAEQRMESIA